jgi:hypothetical protein
VSDTGLPEPLVLHVASVMKENGEIVLIEIHLIHYVPVL